MKMDVILIICFKLALAGVAEVWEADMASLALGKWLNDNIIDFYIQYVIREKSASQYEACFHAFNCQFFKALTKNHKYKDVARWTKNVNIFEKEFIVIPMNIR